MNRAARRKMASDLRRAGSDATRISITDWTDYIQHLPRVPLDEPEQKGRVYHLISHHEPSCRSWTTGQFEDCDCRVAFTKHLEPVRQ
jgi:hypothetical protein